MRRLSQALTIILFCGLASAALADGLYMPAGTIGSPGSGCITSGSAVIKGNGSGGCINATAGTDFLGTGVTGDCVFTSPSLFTCTKTNGVPFAPVATSGSATDIHTGTLPNAQLPANISVTNLTASGLTPGQCVQAGTGGLLTSAGAACGTGGGGGGGVGPGTGPALAQYPTGNSSTVVPATVSGDGTIAQGGLLRVLSTGGTLFSPSATIDATNAANISTNTLAAARLPLGIGTAPPTAGQILIGNAGGTAFVLHNLSGDVTLSATGATLVSKLNSFTIAPSATTDTTNAVNITSGVLAAARGGAGAVSGILKANGAGLVSAAISGTDYQPAIAGNTLAAHNVANAINAAGTLSGIQLSAADITGLAASATTDTTVATNIATGTLNNARLPANIAVTNLTASALTAGQCVQTTTGGLLATTGSACGAGGGATGTVSSGTGPAMPQYASGTGTTVNPVTISLDASIAQGGAVSVTGLHFGGTDIQTSGTAPTNGQCLVYNGTTISGVACAGGGGTVTTGSNPQIPQYTGASSTTLGPVTVGGDCTMANGGNLTCLSTGGTLFAASATTNTTNASNISSGTLGASRLPSRMHTLSGATPVVVVNSSTVGLIDINDLTLSANVTSFTLPLAGSLADGEEAVVKVRQPNAGGPFTLPTGTAGTPFTAGAGTTIANSVSTIAGCPSIPTGANQEIDYDLYYEQTLTKWVVLGCTTVPSQNYPYDVTFAMSGAPAPSQIFPNVCTREVDFPANFANSQATCGINPTGTNVYNVLVAGGNIGTVTLSSSCVPTFATTSGLTQKCLAGQRIELDAPAGVSGSNMAIALTGTR